MALAALRERRASMDKVLSFLRHDEADLAARLAELERELGVARAQVGEQEAAVAAAAEEEAELEAKLRLVKDTLEPLALEEEKLELLVAGARAMAV